MKVVAAPQTDALREALREHFGFDDFNAGQRTVIEDVIAGRPTIAVMPTGAGKSLCYQLPALLLEGVAVVVSPLIALMKDQVDALQARGIAAAFVNSSQSPDEQRRVIDQVADGELKLIYVAPERFRHNAFVRALQRATVSLFAVDEAHCISRWGHDFRPDYTRIGAVIDRLEPPRVLACTATATAEVRDDIVGSLHLTAPSVHVHGFMRPNLFLEARLVGGDKDREKRLRAFLRGPVLTKGTVIIYASTRKRVEKYAKVVSGLLGPKKVVAYHGGMTVNQRKDAQEHFMQGEASVAVATNAFGMGVDRGDVRAVIHVDLPRTVEGYYQEVGRAGRDGEPANCLLLYNPIDTRVHEFLIDQSHPSPEAITAVWHLLKRLPEDQSISLQGVQNGISDLGLEGMAESALRRLGRSDAVRYEGYDSFSAHPEAPVDVQQLGIDFESITIHREHELAKLQRMRSFVHHPGCRHAFVLQYFGEPMQIECPGCDRCSGDGVGGVPGVQMGEPTEEESLVIRKALAGVARAEGRFGMRKIADMLAGSKAKTIANTSLVRLSTYGVLKGLNSKACAELLQLLIEQGLCSVSTGKYPMLHINDAGWAVMRGDTPANFHPPAHLIPGATAAKRAKMLRSGRAAMDPGAAPDANALILLRAFRTQRARDRGVPPYVIFNDRSMTALAAQRPTDEASFLALPGLGPSKWSNFGEAVVNLLADL